MKKLLFGFVLAVLTASTTMGVGASADEQQARRDARDDPPMARTSEDGTRYVPGEVVVVKKGGLKEDNVEVLPVEEQTLVGLERKAEEVKGKRPDAEAVEPNYVLELAATPNDDRYPDQYFFRQIGAPSAWSVSKGDGIRVCVIDSGYDHGNAELASKVVAERDVVGDTHDAVAEDDIGHGTHVAGIAAAQTNNGVGTAGVGWNSKLVVAKAFDAEGNGTIADLAQALNYCQNAGGVSVVNMSFAGARGSEALKTEVAESNRIGMTLVAAAGNYRTSDTLYPAGYPGVIGVGASDRDGALRASSDTGPTVDLVAPGEEILSAYPNTGVASLSGTSTSAPQVAGGAALLHARGLDRDRVRARLFNQAEDRGPVGRDDLWGHGFLDLRCAARPGLDGCN